MELKIVDDNKVVWLWDGHRIRVEGSDEEFESERIPVEENGYQAETFEEAVRALEENDAAEMGRQRVYRVDYASGLSYESSRYFMDRASAQKFRKTRVGGVVALNIEWLRKRYDTIPLGLILELLNRYNHAHHTIRLE